MNLVIIEDERLVADDLEKNIRKLIPENLNIVQLRSVKEAIAYFKSHLEPDMIFSDIQLGDGLSFEIFIAVKLTAPVVFCTAYDVYALDAFKANGIDYILKPFTKQTLESALNKYHQLKKLFSGNVQQPYTKLLDVLGSRGEPQASSILVYFQDKIIPIKLEDIALFYIENDITKLLTFSGKAYFPNKNLDELEKLAGNQFFRANRQFLVYRKVIIDVSSYFSRKLSLNLTINFPDKITVSKEKASQFLEWLASV